MHNFVKDDPKTAVLLEIWDDTIAVKKHTNGKILSSFLYGFGKAAAVAWEANQPMLQELEFNQYFSICFDLMWDLFPNWQMLDKAGCYCQRGRGQKASLRAFCRFTAQAVGRQKLKRIVKNCLRVIASTENDD